MRRISGACIFALLALQWLWHAWLAPQTLASPVMMAAAFSLPILPAAVLFAFGQRHAAYWGALAALLYFTHGVMLVWASPEERGLAAAQTLLSVALVLSSSWEGIRARMLKRKRAADV
jgi:uncharacterized membrane protein